MNTQTNIRMMGKKIEHWKVNPTMWITLLRALEKKLEKQRGGNYQEKLQEKLAKAKGNCRKQSTD